MTRLLSTRKGHIITLLGLILIAVLIATSILIVTKLGTSTNEDEYKQLDPSISKVPDYYSNGKSVEIDGYSTGLKLNPELEYSISQNNITQCEDSTDTGYMSLSFANNDSLRFYLLNKTQLGETSFMDYYNRFAGKFYSEYLPNLAILHTYCDGSNYIELISNIENYTINSTNYLNIFIGGYQYAPSEDEYVKLSGSFHAYNPNNLVQIDFVLPELFKYNEVDNFESCKNDMNTIDLKCYSKLIENNSERVNQITVAAQETLDNLNIYFE